MAGEVDLYDGSEASRIASTFVPPAGSIILTDRGFYLADGATSMQNLTPPYDPPGAADAVRADLSGDIQALASRVSPQPRTVQYQLLRTLTTGLCPCGPFVNAGFTAHYVTAFLDTAPVGRDAIMQIIDGRTSAVLYTTTIPDGATSIDDPNAFFVVNDQTQLKINFTQVGLTTAGANLVVAISEDAGPPASIGAATDLATTSIGGTVVGLSWSYTGAATPDHFTIVWKRGASAPVSLSDGTAFSGIDGSALNANVQGLTPQTTVSFSIWPVAVDGTLGTPASLTGVGTSQIDTTPPGPIPLPNYQASQGSITWTWQWPSDPDVWSVIIRRKNDSTSTTWATLSAGQRPTEGRPAGGGLTATGDGRVVTIDQGNTFSDTGLNANSNYSYAFWTADSTGNINPVPVVRTVTTLSAPSGFQGDNLVVPRTYRSLFLDDFHTQSLASYTGPKSPGPGFQGWGHAEEGPTSHSNIDVIADPDLAGHYVMRMRMRRFQGWADSTSSIYKNHKGWFGDGSGGYYTDGTGHYGSRLQVYDAPSQASGALEVTWKVANADGSPATVLAHGTKGLTLMWFPDNGWPKDELDIIEIFTAAQLQANMHYLTSSNGNGQVWSGHSANQPWNIFNWITTTCLWEPPPAGAAGNGRIRLYHKQTGVNGGNPVVWFDTEPPYVADNAGADKMTRLLTQANPGHIGMAVAWNPGAVTYDKASDTITGGSTFGCPAGNGAGQRNPSAALIRKIQWWQAA